jgi:hypothetical protein
MPMFVRPLVPVRLRAIPDMRFAQQQPRRVGGVVWVRRGGEDDPPSRPIDSRNTLTRSVTLINNGKTSKWARIYQTEEPLACYKGCVYATRPLKALSNTVEVLPPDPNAPKGMAKAEQARIDYNYPLLKPGQTVRVYWRDSEAALGDAGPTDKRVNTNNARIRLGLETVKVDQYVTTGGGDGYSPCLRCQAVIAGRAGGVFPPQAYGLRAGSVLLRRTSIPGLAKKRGAARR